MRVRCVCASALVALVGLCAAAAVEVGGNGGGADALRKGSDPFEDDEQLRGMFKVVKMLGAGGFGSVYSVHADSDKVRAAGEDSGLQLMVDQLPETLVLKTHTPMGEQLPQHSQSSGNSDEAGAEKAAGSQPVEVGGRAARNGKTLAVAFKTCKLAGAAQTDALMKCFGVGLSKAEGRDEFVFTLLEFVEGAQMTAAARQVDHRLDMVKALKLLLQGALDLAEAGIVNFDLKPENTMVQVQNGHVQSVKMVDLDGLHEIGSGTKYLGQETDLFATVEYQCLVASLEPGVYTLKAVEELVDRSQTWAVNTCSVGLTALKIMCPFVSTGFPAAHAVRQPWRLAEHLTYDCGEGELTKDAQRVSKGSGLTMTDGEKMVWMLQLAMFTLSHKDDVPSPAKSAPVSSGAKVTNMLWAPATHAVPKHGKKALRSGTQHLSPSADGAAHGDKADASSDASSQKPMVRMEPVIEGNTLQYGCVEYDMGDDTFAVSDACDSLFNYEDAKEAGSEVWEQFRVLPDIGVQGIRDLFLD